MRDFTERGKRVFQIARSEALRLGSEALGTEHILLGLLEDKDGIVPQILTSFFNVEVNIILNSRGIFVTFLKLFTSRRSFSV